MRRVMLIMALLASVAGAQKQFALADTSRFPAWSRMESVAVGDVDRNGWPDVVYGLSNGPTQLLLNQGHGRFVFASDRVPRHLDTDAALVLTDVNGDGFLDLVKANNRGPDRLYLNSAGRRFVVSSLPTTPSTSWSVASGDVDSDGDRDLVIGRNSDIQLLVNDGRGRFSDQTRSRILASQPLSTVGHVEIVDFYGNGQYAILAVSSGGAIIAYENDGKGFFRQAHLVTPLRISALGGGTFDLDLDGDLDLVLAVGFGQSRLLVNDGGWRFRDVTATSLPMEREYTADIVRTDINRDGCVDLVFANGSVVGPQPIRVLLNDGKGKFIPHDPSRATAAGLRHRAVDRNGRRPRRRSGLDLGRHGVEVLHQPHRAGGCNGATRRSALAGDRVEPRLDLGRALLLPPASIPSPSGQAAVVLRIPADPSVRGQPIATQAVVAPSLSVSSWRLTNLEARTVQ